MKTLIQRLLKEGIEPKPLTNENNFKFNLMAEQNYRGILISDSDEILFGLFKKIYNYFSDNYILDYGKLKGKPALAYCKRECTKPL
jgi:hypothetical protein